MSASPWDELGIAPTADQGAIRRAYAGRLKTIDVDRDPAAFIALRQAFTDALEGGVAPPAGQPGEQDDEDTICLPPPPAPSAAVAVPPSHDEMGPPHGEFAGFRAKFAGGDWQAAAAALKSALAHGIVPIGKEAELSAALVGRVLADQTAGLDDLDEVARTFGAARDDGVFGDLRLRVDALRWLAAIEADTRRGDGWGMVRHWADARVRIARAIRTRSTVLLWRRDLAGLQAEAANARRHAPRLAGRIDADRIDQAVRLFARRITPKWWRPMVALILMVAAGAATSVGNGRGDTISLVVFAGALMVVEGWVFTLAGLALLALVAASVWS